MPTLPAGRARVAVALVTVSAALACVTGAGASARPLGFGLGRPAPIEIGVATAQAPSLGPVLAYTRAAGESPAIIEDFRDFGAPLFYSTDLASAAAVGATLMVTWDPAVGGAGIALAGIASGAYDAYLHAQAVAAASWGRPILIRFGHEMNLPQEPWGDAVNGNTPALYVAAWRHVVAVFRAAGAHNVRWVWSPNVDCGGACPFDAYFPGDRWVDYVALDGYNFGLVHGVAWESFHRLFAGSYATLTRLSRRPVIIAETASLERGGSKAHWIRRAFLHDIPREFTRVVAVVWWDRVDQARWLVNSSPSALAAWKQVVSSPLYRLRRAGARAVAPG